jgi:hypothetical protein
MKKQTKKKVAVESYSAKIKVLGKIFQSSGDSVLGALSNLKVPKGKGMSILTISRGKESQDRILSAPQTARLFSLSPLMREIALKNVSNLFGL